VGIWRPAAQTFMLHNANGPAAAGADVYAKFGEKDDIPLVGNWDGK